MALEGQDRFDPQAADSRADAAAQTAATAGSPDTTSTPHVYCRRGCGADESSEEVHIGAMPGMSPAPERSKFIDAPTTIDPSHGEQ